MKNFMENVLRYLSNDIWTPDAKAIMTVSAPTGYVYFKTSWAGYWETVHRLLSIRIFTGISVEHLTSYGDLNPMKFRC